MGVGSEVISRVLNAVPNELLIGGKWVATEQTLDVEDPSTGEVLTSVADASTEEGIAALDAAVEASEGWEQTDPRERGEILRRAFTLLTERAEDIALVMTLEMGKPLTESRTEVTYGAEFLRWFSEEAVRIAGRYSVAPSGGTRLVTVKQPVGPVYAMTPRTTLALAAILIEAGLPDGVVNVITTSHSAELSSPIMADPRLRKITFTGSTEVGRRLIEQSAQKVLRISMELGGNAPFLVLADADLDKAVDGAMLAKMRNIGEACTAANRFLVHESLAGEFASRLAERMGGMTSGRGIEEGVQVGPLIDTAAVDKVTELVTDAVDAGAEVLTGGSAIEGAGYFYRPTVLGGVPPSARVNSEEIFGPVAPIISFSSDEEGIALANDTEFGLVAYAFTESLTRALTVAEGLETGMVGINQGIVSNPAAPFGGVKASGLGREGGPEGIEEYLETKYVGIRL